MTKRPKYRMIVRKYGRRNSDGWWRATIYKPTTKKKPSKEVLVLEGWVYEKVLANGLEALAEVAGEKT